MPVPATQLFDLTKADLAGFDEAIKGAVAIGAENGAGYALLLGQTGERLADLFSCNHGLAAFDLAATVFGDTLMGHVRSAVKTVARDPQLMTAAMGQLLSTLTIVSSVSHVLTVIGKEHRALAAPSVIEYCRDHFTLACRTLALSLRSEAEPELAKKMFAQLKLDAAAIEARLAHGLDVSAMANDDPPAPGETVH